MKNFQNKMIILVVSLAMFIELLDGSALNASLPQIAREFSLLPIDLSLAITGYLFALGVCIPCSAWFVGKFGIKKVMTMAFIIFALASIGAGFSTNLNELVFFRFLQGIGGSFMLPVGRLAIVQTFGKNLIRAMATVTSISLIGPMLGPVVGGYISTNFGWQWIFFINIPCSIFSIILISKYFPASKYLEVPPQFDVKGFSIIFTGFAFLIFSGETFKTNEALVLRLCMIIAGLLILFSYIAHAKKVSHSLLDIKILDNEYFKNIVLGNFLIRFSIAAFPFLIPVFLSQRYALSSFQIGLSMLPFILGTWLMKPVIARLPGLLKNTRLLVMNAFMMSLVQWGLIYFVAYFSIKGFIFYGIILGMISSIQFSLMNVSMFSSLKELEVAQGNAVYLTLSQLGGCLGVALTASICILFDNLSIQEQFAYYCAIFMLGMTTMISCYFFRKCLSSRVNPS